MARDDDETTGDEFLDDEDDGDFDDTDDEDGDEVTPGRAGSFAVGLVVGVAIGAAAALFLTPMSGRDLRKRVRRGVEDARDRIGDDVQDLRRRVRRRLRQR
jgi:hypothetical protein